MLINRILRIFGVLCLLVASAFVTARADKFEVGKSEFLLNGSPFVIKAAELHYPRIPVEYWEQRIQLCKALGMNTICLYTFWNIHEPKEGEFDFTGNNDIRKFIELCSDNGMKVILRPGPYVCAEWEMGGLPWWLLKDKDIALRENDPRFLERVRRFEKVVADQVADLTIDKGGPVIMIQVENEYGSYGENKDYIRNIRDIIRENYGNDVALFQCDWSSNFTLNGLDDLIWTMNFGTGADIDSQFYELKKLRPDSPLMCSEFWSGWFDKWGAAHETRPADEMIKGIDEMLSKGISFSLYMTHGGTNWGHWAGANSPGYSPDVTSYDYDAPISESGQPTEKYWLLRETLKKYLADTDTLPGLPQLVKPISISEFQLSEVAPLWDNLPPSSHHKDLKTFEDLDMGFGTALYSTTLPATQDGTILRVTEPHDFAQIFVAGEKIGVLDRRLGQTDLEIGSVAEGTRLDILVEATGRINFGRAIKDFKGISQDVTLVSPDNKNETEVKDWDIALFPDELSFYKGLNFVENKTQSKNEGRFPAGVYRGTFQLDSVSDSFLNFESWGKGLVYVNGKGIGRIWEEGPQQTLYVPGPWLREGENEIVVFDILGPTSASVEGFEHPVIDKLQLIGKSEDFNLDIPEETSSLRLKIPEDPGWKELKWEKPLEGRFVCLEIANTEDGEPEVAVAELYLLDEKGNRLPRENWKSIADSQEAAGNHTPEKAYDLQESTYWQSQAGKKLPHYLIIDLGDRFAISGIQYLPRMEKNSPGKVGEFNIHISNKNFVE